MSELVTKISVQAKIAELERRIQVLEAYEHIVNNRAPKATPPLETGAWSRLWKALDELFS